MGEKVRNAERKRQRRYRRRDRQRHPTARYVREWAPHVVEAYRKFASAVSPLYLQLKPLPDTPPQSKWRGKSVFFDVIVGGGFSPSSGSTTTRATPEKE